ncbi:hypothetical protein PanWU01x14_076530, partial [Parasponia andersonii]
DVVTTKKADPIAVATKGKKILKSLGSKSRKSKQFVITSLESISATSEKEITAPSSVAPILKKSATTSETEEDPSMIPEEELFDIPEENITEDQDEGDSPDAVAIETITGYDISLAHSTVSYTIEMRFTRMNMREEDL